MWLESCFETEDDLFLQLGCLNQVEPLFEDERRKEVNYNLAVWLPDGCLCLKTTDYQSRSLIYTY